MKRCKRFFVLCVCVFFLMNIGVSFADYISYVKTPKGSNVRVWGRTWELSPEEIQDLDDDVKDTFQNAILVKSSTRKYNCHSYAWYSQSSRNNKWMNDPSKYMCDGSYAGYCANYPAYGDKVYYDAGDHSAISLGRDWVVSKWGKGPLMIHGITYGPYNNMSDHDYFTRTQ